MSGTHIALIRGINVGTAKRVAMADLRRMVEGLGYSDVRTLLNSGNVVLTAARTGPDSVRATMESGLTKKLGVTARITVLTAKELGAIVDGNPLLKVADNHSRLFVSVLASPATRPRLLPISRQKWPGEAFVLGDRVAYMWCPGGSLNSPLAQAAHKLLKDDVTTRTWATLLKLRAIVEE